MKPVVFMMSVIFLLWSGILLYGLEEDDPCSEQQHEITTHPLYCANLWHVSMQSGAQFSIVKIETLRVLRVPIGFHGAVVLEREILPGWFVLGIAFESGLIRSIPIENLSGTADPAWDGTGTIVMADIRGTILGKIGVYQWSTSKKIPLGTIYVGSGFSIGYRKAQLEDDGAEIHSNQWLPYSGVTFAIPLLAEMHLYPRPHLINILGIQILFHRTALFNSREGKLIELSPYISFGFRF
jgi:hypothetical protein